MTTRRRRKCRHWGRAEGELRGSGEWRASPRSSEKEIRLFGEKVSSIHTELEFRERAVLAVPLRMGRVPAVVYWLRRPAHKRSRPIPKHERNDAIKSLRLAMELDWYGVPPTGHGLTARGCGGRWSSSDAAKLPMRCRITLPPEDRQPQSTDPEVSSQWSLSRRREGYDRGIASWRAQLPRAVVHDPAIERQPVEDFSEDD